VLTTRPKGKVGSFGGKGVTVQEVLNFLESVVPKVSGPLSRSAVATMSKRAIRSEDPSAAVSNLKIPLVNGRALGVTYLGWNNIYLFIYLFCILYLLNSCSCRVACQ